MLAHQHGLDARPLAGVCRWVAGTVGWRGVVAEAGQVAPCAALPTAALWLTHVYTTAALLNGATIALLQGSPQGRPFGEFVEAAGVTMLGVVPSIVKVRLVGTNSEGSV